MDTQYGALSRSTIFHPNSGVKESHHVPRFLDAAYWTLPMARPTTIEDRQLPVTIMVLDVADMGMEAEEEAANVEVRW